MDKSFKSKDSRNKSRYEVEDYQVKQSSILEICSQIDMTLDVI